VKAACHGLNTQFMWAEPENGKILGCE